MTIINTHTHAPFLIYINCTLKNTIITVVHSETKKIILQTSCRSYPLKIKKKNNAYILQKISLKIINELKNLKCINLKIFIKGIGRGRFNIIKYLSQKFNILTIEDRTPIPFNGCKPSKVKRR